MPIYVGVNGEAKLVTEAYIGNRNNQAVPLYLSNIIPKGYLPVDYISYLHGSSYPLVQTNILPTVYSKIIFTFIPFFTDDGGGGPFLFKLGELRAYYSAGRINKKTKAYLNYKIGNLEQSQLILENSTSDLSSISLSNYCTLIINESSAKDSYIKFGNQEKILLGYNTTSYFNNIERFGFLMGSPYYAKTYPLFCYCAIYKNVLTDITPTAEFFPCIKADTSKVGIYETVSSTFYSCSGEDYLSAGPVVERYNLPSFD